MDRLIFVNLPVRDVGIAARFYTALGFGLHERFSDDDVACVAVSPSILVMLIEQRRYAELIAEGAPTAAAGLVTPVCSGLSASSRAEVDDLVERAALAGGDARAPVVAGAMYGRSFADPDGHVWELIHVGSPGWRLP